MVQKKCTSHHTIITIFISLMRFVQKRNEKHLKRKTSKIDQKKQYKAGR